MDTLRPGTKSEDIRYLCLFLNEKIQTKYSGNLIELVKKFQIENCIQDNGVVGPSTWIKLYIHYRGNSESKIDDDDINWLAKIFNLEFEVLAAVIKICSKFNEGLLSSKKPVISFNSFIFWKELKRLGKNPKNYVKGNEKLLSITEKPELNCTGEKEWNRLDKAMKISQEAALKSTSWGIFQISGINYNKCGYSDIFDFVDGMRDGDFTQLIAFMRYLKKLNYIKYLGKKDWEEFSLKLGISSGQLEKEYNILRNKKKIRKHDNNSTKKLR